MCSTAPWLRGRYSASPLVRAWPPPFRLHRLPGFAGYTIARSTGFPDGTKTVSPVARHVLATVLSLPPRRSDIPLQSDCGMPCCLRPEGKGSTSGLLVSRPPVGSLSLRPGDSLTAPRAALSVGFIRFVSSTNATQATGLRLLPRWDCLPLNMPAFAGHTPSPKKDPTGSPAPSEH